MYIRQVYCLPVISHDIVIIMTGLYGTINTISCPFPFAEKQPQKTDVSDPWPSPAQCLNFGLLLQMSLHPCFNL